MSLRSRWSIVFLVALVFVVSLPAAVRALLARWEDNPILRGRQLAERQGCLGCHQPYGGVEIPNPGSRWSTVPRFGGGNAFMYAPERQAIEEFIRYGAPRAWLDEPEIRERIERQHVRMPAYGDVLDDREIDDLVAYVAAVEGVERAGGEAAEPGRAIARQHGCLSCHGVEGAGGVPNPGSLGGFVPGFLGRNFEDLVEDREEFEEWVLDGTSSRLEARPWIRWFWDRQKIDMPAYRGELGDEEVELLWQWVQAVRADLETD